MNFAKQIKASPTLLGWNAAGLVKQSTVGETILRRYEMLGCVLEANLSVLIKLNTT